MTSGGLASLFGPTLLRQKISEPPQNLELITQANKITEDLILYYPQLFEGAPISSSESPHRRFQPLASHPSHHSSPSLTNHNHLSAPLHILVQRKSSPLSTNSWTPSTKLPEITASPHNQFNVLKRSQSSDSLIVLNSAQRGPPSPSALCKEEPFITKIQPASPSLPRSPSPTPSQSKLHKISSQSTAEVTICSPSKLHAAKEALYNTKEPLSWILISYIDKCSIELAKSGDSLQELADLFNDQQMQYVLLVISLTNKEANKPVSSKDIVSYRRIFVTWMGPLIPKLEKGIKSSHLWQVKDALKPFHSEVTVVSKQNFTRQVLIERTHPLSGSPVID